MLGGERCPEADGCGVQVAGVWSLYVLIVCNILLYICFSCVCMFACSSQEVFCNFLLLLAYVICPWTGVLLHDSEPLRGEEDE